MVFRDKICNIEIFRDFHKNHEAQHIHLKIISSYLLKIVQFLGTVLLQDNIHLFDSVKSSRRKRMVTHCYQFKNFGCQSLICNHAGNSLLVMSDLAEVTPKVFKLIFLFTEVITFYKWFLSIKSSLCHCCRFPLTPFLLSAMPSPPPSHLSSDFWLSMLMIKQELCCYYCYSHSRLTDNCARKNALLP